MSAYREAEWTIGGLLDYVEHQTWRCAYRERFPWPEGDCRCGLVALLTVAGLPLHHADVPDPDSIHRASEAKVTRPA